MTGHLDDRWARRFGGLSLSCLPGSETMLAGRIADQAALHGILSLIRDPGLQLLLAKDLNLPLPWFLAAIGARTVIVLIALVAGIRIFGRRGVGGLTLVDLAMVLLLGNSVQNAMTVGSGHLGVGLVSAGVLLVLDRMMGLLFVRRPWIEKKLTGEPTVIGADGRLDEPAMRREGVARNDVFTALRLKGLSELSQMRLAVLEPDGTISIIACEAGDGSSDESGGSNRSDPSDEPDEANRRGPA